MRKSVFAICDDHNAYIGYTSGRTWNGWATPYFTLAEVQRLQADWHGLTYDEANDEFRIQYDEGEEPYIWKGEDVQTVDGKLHLYGIGAYSHIWDELGDEYKLSLAQGVADFMLQYDTYNYIDNDETYDNMVEDVAKQLANEIVFVDVYNAMNDTRLTKTGIYARLIAVLEI